MGEFIVKKTRTGFVFHLKSANNRTIGISQVYASMAGVKVGVHSVKHNCASHIEDQTVEYVETLSPAKYEVYIDKAGEYRFRLKAANGENILASHAYKSKSGCMHGIESVKSNAPNAPVIDETVPEITHEEAYENDADMDFMKDRSVKSDESCLKDAEVFGVYVEEIIIEPRQRTTYAGAKEASSSGCGCGKGMTKRAKKKRGRKFRRESIFGFWRRRLLG